MPVPRTPPAVRAQRFYDAGSAEKCWPWRGCSTRGGYGQIWDGDKMIPAHRVVYEAKNGPIPEGLQIDHLCRNTPCVNPSHLEPVTAQENNRRSESPSGRNARKTHCDSGHEFTFENTGISKRGDRYCRACMRGHALRYYYERKAGLR